MYQFSPSLLSLRLWTRRDALYRTAVATAVPCSLRTATEGGQIILRDDHFHNGLRVGPGPCRSLTRRLSLAGPRAAQAVAAQARPGSPNVRPIRSPPGPRAGPPAGQRIGPVTELDDTLIWNAFHLRDEAPGRPWAGGAGEFESLPVQSRETVEARKMNQASTEADNKVLRRIKEEHKEDNSYGKNTHGRSLDDMDIFEAEFNIKRVANSMFIGYERDDHSSEFTAPLLVKTLPEAVRQRLDNMEDLCFFGIVCLDIHPLAWVSVDNSLCLWISPLTLAHPPPTRVIHVKDYITSVALVKANPEKTYACDGDPPYFLAVALRECILFFQIYLQDMELVVRETSIEISIDSFICKMVSTENGRLFVGCKDGNVYEIDFAEADDSFGSLFYRKRKTNCNKSAGILSSTMTVLNVMRNVLLGAKPQEPVAFLVYDPSRHIVLALTQSRTVDSISGNEGSSTAHLHAFFLDSRGSQGELLCERKPPAYKGPFSIHTEPHVMAVDANVKENFLGEFVALHPISKDECGKLNAVLVSSAGLRAYISVTEQDGFSCRALRPPPTVEQGGWANTAAKSAKLSASVYHDGLWLVTCADRSRTAGSLFCISQDRNCPPRSLSNSLTQSPQRKTEIISAYSAAALQVLPATVWAIQEVPPCFWYSTKNSSCLESPNRILSTHELFDQHIVQHRKFLILCRNGIFVVARRQPWEKMEFYLSRFPELVTAPEKLSKVVRITKEQLCATAVLWWVRSAAVIDDRLSYPRAAPNESQNKAIQLFTSIDKLEAGRGGLGLIIALSRVLRPVWASSNALGARDWCRVAAELELVKRFVEALATLEIPSPRKGPEKPHEIRDNIRQSEVLETIAHSQQLCSLLYLVMKGGGSLASLHQGGLGALLHSYYKNLKGLGADPILDLVRSLSDASFSQGNIVSKKTRWAYEDTPSFQDVFLLSRAEQEQLDALLSRLLPPAKLAQARADKELSKARALYDEKDWNGTVDCVRKAQEQLMGIARDLTSDDLKRYAGGKSQDIPSASFGYVLQPVAFLHVLLHRFANQSVVATEEVQLALEFIQDMYQDADGDYEPENRLDAALLLLIQHNGLYRNAQCAPNFLDRSASGLENLHGTRLPFSSFNQSMQGSYSEEREERAMWPLLRGLIESYWRSYVEEREKAAGQSRSVYVEADNSSCALLWSRLVGLIGARYVDSPQLGAKPLLEVESFLRSPATTGWLNERAQRDSIRGNLAEWFLSHCQGELLQEAGLFAKAGHLCYLRAKQVSDANLEDRIESLLEAKKAAALNGGQLAQAQVSVSSLEFEASLATLQLQLKRRSSDLSAEMRFGKALMHIGALFEACCNESLFDLALDVCALSASYNETTPTSVIQPLWKNMLDKAWDEGNIEEVLRQQGRKFLRRDGFFPLEHIVGLLEDEIVARMRDERAVVEPGFEPSAVLLDIGVPPLRLVEAYVERVDSRPDQRVQQRCVQVVVKIYTDLLDRAQESGQEAMLPLTNMENDLLRLETHPSLSNFRRLLFPARSLLDRFRNRLTVGSDV